MTRFPSLDLLRTFSLAATYLNVSRVAAELCLTQSAVSRQLKLLEQQLQVQLFIRTNRGLTLTDKGVSYFAQIRQPMKRIYQATSAMLPVQNSLALYVDSAFAHTWLVKRLPQFKRLNPEITFELRLGSSMHTVTGGALHAGHDVQIVFGSPPWAGYRSERLLEMQEFPVCSPRLLRSKSRSMVPAELKNKTLIHEGDRRAWRKWLAVANATEFESEVATVVHDSLTCLTMAIDGQGIAIGDNLTCADYIESGILIKPFTESAPSEETFCLAIADDNYENPTVQKFRDWLCGLIQLET